MGEGSEHGKFFFSRARIASMRMISKAIISLARRLSAAVEWTLNIGMSERRCARL